MENPRDTLVVGETPTALSPESGQLAELLYDLIWIVGTRCFLSKLGRRGSGWRCSNDCAQSGEECELLVRDPFNDPSHGSLQPNLINGFPLDRQCTLMLQLFFEFLQLWPGGDSPHGLHVVGKESLDPRQSKIECQLQLGLGHLTHGNSL